MEVTTGVFENLTNLASHVFNIISVFDVRWVSLTEESAFAIPFEKGSLGWKRSSRKATGLKASL